MSLFAPPTPGQEQQAIDALTGLPSGSNWMPEKARIALGAQAIATALSVTPEHGEAILIELEARSLIVFSLQQPLDDKRTGAWCRVEPE